MKYFLFLLCFVFSTSIFAQQAWTATSSGTWNSSGSGLAGWSCSGAGCSGIRPTPEIGLSGKTITIPSGISITGTAALTGGNFAGTLSIIGSLSAASLSINSNGPTTINGGTLTLSGAFTASAGWSGATNITASVNAASFTYSNGTGVTITGNLTTTGNITQSGGSGDLTINGNMVSSGGNIIKSGGQNTIVSGNVTATTGTITQSGGLAFTVGGNLSAGGLISKTNGTNFTVTGNMTSTGSGLSINGGTGVLSVGGNTSLFGAYSIQSGPSATFGGAFSTSSISSTGGSGTTFNGPVTTPGALAMDGGTMMTFNSTFSGASVNINNSADVVFNGVTAISGNITAVTGSTVSGNTTSLSYGSVGPLNNGGAIIGSNNPASCSYTTVASVPPSPLNLSACNLTPLPITLAYFNADFKAGLFFFDWSTLQEINNDFFTIEYSLESKIFTPIKQIAGAGNSNSVLNYSLEGIELPLRDDTKTVYFRLKQTDYDGSFAYSYIVPVLLDNTQNESSIVLFPNPAKDNLTLRVENFTDFLGLNEVVFTNALGQKKSKTIEITSKETLLDVSDIESGFYLIVLDGAGEWNNKIVIRK